MNAPLFGEAPDSGRGTGRTSSTVWINGVRQPDGGASVSVHDRGLTLGDGLFETMYVRRGRAFRLDRHLARLHRGLLAMGIAAPVAIDEWVLGAVSRDAQLTGDGDASLRVTVTRGVGPGGVGVPPDATPTVIVTVGAMPVFPASIYTRGLAVHVASGRRNERAMTAGLKTLAYADAVVALVEAQRAGADEALFLDTDGHCSEATASNLFAMMGSALVTPPISCGALPGITREAVVELAQAQGVPVEERAFGLDELTASREVFLTSSLRQLVPVIKVGSAGIGAGVPGPLTVSLMAAYTALVERECGA